MNLDLELLKAEVEKEISAIAKREELLLLQLSNVRSLLDFLEGDQGIRERCIRPATSEDETDGRHSRKRNSGIRVCPRCSVRVLPTMDGRCPSCQNQFSRE